MQKLNTPGATVQLLSAYVFVLWCCSILFRLYAIHFSVLSIQKHQLIVRTAFDDLTTVEHIDFICHSRSGESVWNKDNRSSFCIFEYRLIKLILSNRVECTWRLIHNDKLKGSCKHSCDCYLLRLTARETNTFFAELRRKLRVDSVWQGAFPQLG